MEFLDETHTNLVKAAIGGESAGTNLMADDLLDHVCCFVEDQLQQGLDFNSSLGAALAAIIPNGIAELEQELTELNLIKPQKNMKRIFYVSSFICSFSLLFSLLAKHWNWQDGSTITLLTGNISLLFFVLPSITIMAIKNKILLNTTDIFRMVMGVGSAALIAIGMIFKTLYFPMANMLINSGFVGLLFLFLPVFYYQLYKRSYL